MTIKSPRIFESEPATPTTALAASAPDQILIRDLAMNAFIGIFTHEYNVRQPIKIDLILDIETDSDHYTKANIVRYDHIVADIESLIADTHFELVETLGEAVAQIVFAYVSVKHARISVTKLDAIKNARAVGVCLHRCRA